MKRNITPVPTPKPVQWVIQVQTPRLQAMGRATWSQACEAFFDRERADAEVLALQLEHPYMTFRIVSTTSTKVRDFKPWLS